MEVNTTQFRLALDQYLKLYPRNVADSLRIRGRLLFARIAKQLPPKTRVQGRNRVRADVRKSENPLDHTHFHDPSIRKMIQRSDLVGIRALVARSKSAHMRGHTVETFSPHYHRLVRNKRTGRVPAYQNLLVVGFPKWKKYVSFRQKRVGLLRGAFALPVTYLGGHVASWVSAPKDLTAGFIKDELASKQKFTFTCALPYADRFSRFVRASMMFESRAMTTDLRLALRRAGITAKVTRY